MEPETSISNWLIRLDDCKSLHRRWLFDETSMKKKLLEVPGMCDDLRWLVLFLQSYQPMRITCHIGFHLPINYDNHLADPSLYLKDWDSHVFFPIGCISESTSRFLGIQQLMKVPNWLKKIQVPETHPKRHRPRPCFQRPGDGRVEANCNGFPAAKKKSFNSWEGIRYHY